MNLNIFCLILLVISEISAKMSMDELEKLSKPGIFETPEQTADFIFKVLNVGSSFGCDVYQTFIDGKKYFLM